MTYAVDFLWLLSVYGSCLVGILFINNIQNFWESFFQGIQDSFEILVSLFSIVPHELFSIALIVGGKTTIYSVSKV